MTVMIISYLFVVDQVLSQIQTKNFQSDLNLSKIKDENYCSSVILTFSQEGATFKKSKNQLIWSRGER